MQTGKKIVLVIPTFLPGGMERVMSELANYFYRQGHQVHVLFLVKHTPFYSIEEGVICKFPEKDYGEQGQFRGSYWLYIMKWLRKNILEIKPHTVFSIPQDYSNLTILALLGTSIPIYISDRNSPNKPIPFLKKRARQLLYPLAKGIIAQTHAAKEGLLGKGIRNKNIRVIPNPVKKIKSLPKPIQEKNVILNIGRLVSEKNQLELIEIFHEVYHPDWVLHIVGDGPLNEQLEAKIEELGREQSIKLIGAVKAVDKEMAKAEIFAFTSIYEGFPNSLNEAMAYPLACISYDCIAGPRDMIEDNVNGYLVERNNKEEYKVKLKKLMEDTDRRKRLANGALLNREKFSLEKIAQNFLDFILPEN